MTPERKKELRERASGCRGLNMSDSLELLDEIERLYKTLHTHPDLEKHRRAMQERILLLESDIHEWASRNRKLKIEIERLKNTLKAIKLHSKDVNHFWGRYRDFKEDWVKEIDEALEEIYVLAASKELKKNKLD